MWPGTGRRRCRIVRSYDESQPATPGQRLGPLRGDRHRHPPGEAIVTRPRFVLVRQDETISTLG